SADEYPGAPGATADFTVTPLVDITLVLLVICMVTAPMIVNNPSIKVELPKAATGDETLKSTLALTLQRESSGGYSLYANGEKTEEPKAVVQITDMVGKDKDL